MARWWERSPPTAVAQVRFLDLASNAGCVCCWFSSLYKNHFGFAACTLLTEFFELLRVTWVNKSRLCFFTSVRPTQ